MLKKNIHNSIVHISNHLKTKNLKQESAILGLNKYNRNNIYHNKKGKH